MVRPAHDEREGLYLYAAYSGLISSIRTGRPSLADMIAASVHLTAWIPSSPSYRDSVSPTMQSMRCRTWLIWPWL